MNKLFFALATLAFLHVARGQSSPPPPAVPGAGPPPPPPADKPTTCGQYQHADRWCKSESVSTVCAYGETFDFDCPAPTKCWKYPNENKVQCLEYRKNAPWPTGPSGNTEPLNKEGKPVSRRRRNMPENKETQSNQANQITQNDQPKPAQAPQADEPKPAPVADKPTSCGQYQHGDRWCKSDSVSSVCAYGETYDFNCDAPAKCWKYPNENKVQCLDLRLNPEPYGTPFPAVGGAKGGGSRHRRSAKEESKPRPNQANQNDQAEPAPAVAGNKPTTCGQYQHGDRWCKSETVSSVCAYGETYDFDCQPGSKCWKYPNEQKVQCLDLKLNAQPFGTPFPVGGGSVGGGGNVQNTEPQSKPQNSEPQPQPQPQEKPQPINPQTEPPTPQTQTPLQTQPTEPQTQPTPQPQPNTPANTQTGTKDCQGPSGPLKDGESVCSGETNYKQCQNGQVVEQLCDQGAKCVQSKTSNSIICRVIIRNAPQADNQTKRRR